MLRSSEIEHLELVQELGEHTRLDLHFSRDSATNVMLDELLGVEATVTLTADTFIPAPVVVFRGVVTGGRQTHHSHHGSALQLAAMSASAKMEYTNARVFRDMKAKDVLSKLGVRVEGAGRGDSMDFLQYDETDFAFAKRLADEHGMFLRTDGDSVVAADTFGEPVELRWGDSLLELESEASPTNHGMKGWFYQMEKKQAHAFHGIRVDVPRFGGAGTLVAAASKLAGQVNGGGDTKFQGAPFRAKRTNNYRDTLERESKRAAAGNVRIRGESINPRLVSGGRIDIVAFEGYRRPPIDGVFGLTRVVHVFDGQQYKNHFEATTASAWLSETAPERELMRGISTGIVVDNIDPAKMGRVKVRFPWSDDAGRWYRVMSSYAGKDRGFFFTPEIEDEVVVAFEHGDPERAIVIGGVWNGIDLPPEKGPTTKSLVTPSGSTLRFIDNNGKEVVEVYSPEGKCLIQLSNAGSKPVLTLRTSGDISIEADGQVRIQAESFLVKTSGDAFVKAGGKATIDAGGDAVVRGGGSATMQAGTNATLKGGANTSVVGGAITNVVGSMVHIQPPGFMAPPLVVVPAQLPKPILHARSKPKPAKASFTADSPTPRQG